MIPYNEQFHLTRTGPTLAADYVEAHRTVGDDAAWVVWPARIERDVCESGLSYDASLVKHRKEWRAALGLPPIVQPGPGPTPPGPVPIVQRGPLPPWDPDSTDPQTGAPLPVAKTLTAQPPVGPDRQFMRANLWGLTVAGLPAIEGGASGAAQERLLTYLDIRYPLEWLMLAVRLYASYGYTHWWRSWPDAHNHGAGESIEMYVDTCKRIQDLGVPFIGHMLRSKDYDPPNPNPDDVNELLDALLAANVIQHASPAWEASLWNSPEHFAAMIQHDAARLVPHGVIVGVHLQAGYAHFGPNITDGDPGSRGIRSARAFWFPCIQAGVKRLYWQADPAWSAGMMQARAADVAVRLVQGGLWGLPETVNWDAFELCGVPLFNNGNTGDGRLATEDTADLLSYEVLCSPVSLPANGYGNGCRRLDGTWL